MIGRPRGGKPARIPGPGKTAKNYWFGLLGWAIGSIVLLVPLDGLPCPTPLQEAAPLQVHEYRIGPKDLLEITVFGLPELNQTVRVAEDGSITMASVGQVEVSGLTARELEKKLASILDTRWTKEARVTVFIKEYQKVSVIGAVSRPGQYELIGPTTLMTIIAQAGGFTAQATNEIFIYRAAQDGQQNVISVRIEDLANGKQDVNVVLQPKDVVTVPIDRTQNVFVYGEVKQPGAISYLSSKRITLLQAVAQAGGPTEWAKTSNVIIKRKDPSNGREIKIVVNLKNMIKGKVSDVVLEEGDVVIIR